MPSKKDPGQEAERQADALEGAASALVASLAELGKAERVPLLDPRAILLGLSRALESSKEAATALAQQGWFEADDPEIADRWQQALAGLGDTAALFEEIAHGWI